MITISLHALECDEGQILCKVDGRCLPKYTKCNGQRDCPDGSDEYGCTG